MSQIVKGKEYRFTVITDSLLRIEQDKNGNFEDRPTTAIVQRDFDKPNFKIIINIF